MEERIKHNLKDILSRFGTTVRSHRKRLGISQEELADRSGLHRTYITDVERGVRNVTMESMCKLIGALGVPFARIFGEMEDVSPEQHAPAASAPHAGLGRPVEILLVEDNPRHADLVLQALKGNGVVNHVSIVDSGEAALRSLFEKPHAGLPDVVLLDVTLAEPDELEVIRRMRLDQRTRPIPVILLTTSDVNPDHVEKLKAQVTGAINKPLEFCEFSALMPRIGFRWVLMEHE